MINDLKIIKKKYGEEMMHFCREAFATILEEPGVLSDLLLTYFEPSKELFPDLEKDNLENSFKAFIYRKLNKEEPSTITGNKTPQELLASVGYDLYECHTEADIQRFKKYYAPGEELCTFNGGRLIDCHVFFAVKKDVDSIKREDFNNPERQDLYGTSVISIQFDKNKAHTLSIKNRYNHTVANPDATYSNNLDNIVKGLTDSFAEHYNLKQAHIANFEIPSYERDNQGKYYKYNYEIKGIYYCTNNCLLVNHEAIKFPKERYILADYFLIDRQEKTIKCYDSREDDSFPQFFQDNSIKKIDLEIKNDIKLVKVETTKGLVTLELDKENKIIGLTNPYIEKIGAYFLYYNESLTKIELPLVKIIGCSFLYNNQNLKSIDLPQVNSIGYGFLYYNQNLKEINFPNVLNIAESFMHNNTTLINLYLPNVINIGDCFLFKNQCLKKLYMPNVINIGKCFLYNNLKIKELIIPHILEVGQDALKYNNSLQKLDIPYLQIMGSNFLKNNHVLEEVYINNEDIYQEFLSHHPELASHSLSLRKIK